MRRRLVLIAIAFLTTSGWLGYREWVFRSEAPLRDGVHAWEVGDYATAWKQILPFAKSGNTHAQRIVAFTYAFGSGVPVDDVRAQIWSRRAEQARTTPGATEYDIGFEYLRRDQARALTWFRRAAEAGHPDAQRLFASPQRLSEKRLPVDLQTVRYWRGIVDSDSN